jgi:hypothetical protein
MRWRMTDERSLFLADVEAFLRKHDMAPSRFGFESCGDYNFVRQLRKGRAVYIDTIRRVRRWMRDYPKRKRGP